MVHGKDKAERGAVSFTDLIQEGSLALIRAAERFHAEKGERFSSYAFKAIWRRCRRASTPASCIVTIPERLKVAARKLSTFKNTFERQHGIVPSDEEQEKISDIALAKVKEAELRLKDGVSLNQPVKNGTVVSVMDVLACPKLSPEQVVQRDLIRQQIAQACLKWLSERDAQVLSLRFGLGDGEPVRGKEIARRMDSNRNAVYKLIHDARLRLRSEFEGAGIAAEDVKTIFA